MDYEQFLEPLSGDDPCGVDPFKDGALYAKLEELDRLRQGTPEQELLERVQDGGEARTVAKTIPGKPPNWQEVRRACETVLGSTRHLRAMVLYGIAELELEGLSALPDILEWVRRSLETHWEAIYPRITEEDPSERVHEIDELSSQDGDDPEDSERPDPRYPDGLFLSHLRDARLFSLPDKRPVTLRIWETAQDPSLHPGVEAPSIELIQTALEQLAMSERDAVRGHLEQSLGRLEELEALLKDKALPVHLRRLRTILNRLKSWLAGNPPPPPPGPGGDPLKGGGRQRSGAGAPDPTIPLPILRDA